MAEQKLDNWFLLPCRTKLTGIIRNNNKEKFPDGTLITTGRLIDYQDGVIYIASGSKYTLGFPRKDTFVIDEESSWPNKEKEVSLIKEKAKIASFFVNEDDVWLRMNCCMENSFYCEDEDTGEVYEIRYQDVGDACGFYKMQLI